MACCEVNIDMPDILFRDYFDKVYPLLSDLMCNAENFEMFGKKDGAVDSYDQMNDLWYMYLYGFIAWYEQQLQFKNLYPDTAGDCPDKLSVMKDIWEDFNFECMVEYFKCKHKLDMREILRNVFGLGTSMGKGIDYMRIENEDDCIPPFKIV